MRHDQRVLGVFVDEEYLDLIATFGVEEDVVWVLGEPGDGRLKHHFREDLLSHFILII